MTAAISLLFAKAATLVSMRNEVTAGIITNAALLLVGRGGSNLCAQTSRGTGVGSNAQKGKFKRGINPLTEMR